MRLFTLLTGMVLAAGLAACGSTSGAPAAGADCCKLAADIQAQMPKCFAKAADGSVSACCKAGQMDASKKADCCKKAEAMAAKMPECCSKNAAGQPQACCAKK